MNSLEALAMQTAFARREEETAKLRDALSTALSMVVDLSNGYSVGELCESIEGITARAKACGVELDA